MTENEQRINEICEILENVDWFQENYTEHIIGPASSFVDERTKEQSKNYNICSVYIKKLEKELIKLLERENKNTQTNPEE